MTQRRRWVLLCVATAAAAGCRGSGPAKAPASAAFVSAPVDGEVAPAPPASEIAPSWVEIARSRQQRAIEAMTVGRGAFRVYLIGGIHGNEPEGQAALPELIALFRGEACASRATVRIVRDMNPDGTAAGRRGNSAGRDLNRNWPAANFAAGRTGGAAPLSEPETAAVVRDLEKFEPQLVIVFHSISGGRGPFVNFDGPASEQATAFAEAAKAVDPRWKVVAQMGYATPGSIGSYVGVDRSLPILTIEFRRGQDGEPVTEAAVSGMGAVIRGGQRGR